MGALKFLIHLGPNGSYALASAPLILAAALLWPGLWSSWFSAIQTRLSALATRTRLMALLLALTPIALRFLLFTNMPPPTAFVHDEFGYLFSADTLLQGRFANPPLVFPEFFESIYVLQRPAYSSIYPPGISATLALGRLLFGHPWGGVLLFIGLMCAGVYWMLLGWTGPGWALIGGVLTIMNWGVLARWANSYQGGGPAAVAGCLIFGALPRLFCKSNPRWGLVIGLGFSCSFLIRPFETVLAVPILVAFAIIHRKTLSRPLIARALLFLAIGAAPGVAVTVMHDHAVTGKYLELPYMLSRLQYGVPETFVFQAAAVPHHTLTREQKTMYQWQKESHDSAASFSGWIRGLPSRLLVTCEYVGWAVSPVLLILPFLRFGRHLAWTLGSIAFVALGTSLYSFSVSYYVAPFIGLYLLLAIAAMQRLNEFNWGQTAVRLVIAFAVLNFATLCCLATVPSFNSLAPRLLDHSWVIANTNRSLTLGRLRKQGGNHLVFVTYGPRHSFLDEWVYNAADVAHAQVIWARDLGPEADKRLIDAYPGRAVWRVTVDRGPVTLTRSQ